MQKKRFFELHNNNPMTKNYPPPSIYFEQEHKVAKKNTSTPLSNQKKKKKYKQKQTKVKKKTVKNKSKNYQKKLTNSKRKQVKKYALKFDGHNRVKKDKKFRNDCSGFVRSIYDKFNIELYDTKRTRRGKKWLNGTELIYNFVQDNGQIFTKKLPSIGDIIFFDNTTDRNRDGKVNDKFTHVAIVIDVKSNGTVHYIHKSNRGINIQKLNLKYPNKAYIKSGKKKIKVNSYLRKRKRKDKKNTPYLSSQMFRAYGSLFKSEKFVKLMK